MMIYFNLVVVTDIAWLETLLIVTFHNVFGTICKGGSRIELSAGRNFLFWRK